MARLVISLLNKISHPFRMKPVAYFIGDGHGRALPSVVEARPSDWRTARVSSLTLALRGPASPL